MDVYVIWVVDAVEVVILDKALGLNTRANAVKIAGAIVIVIVDVHPAVTHRWNPLPAKCAEEVMVEGDVKPTEVVGGIVAAADKANSRLVAAGGGEIEPAPRDGYPVGSSGYIQAAVFAVVDSAFGDKDVVYVLF